MELEVFVTPGLGDNSYLLASGDRGLLVDPQRDAWRFLEVARNRGIRVERVLETHVHNDYVSGAHEVAAAVEAEIVAPEAGGYQFDFHGVAEGDEIGLGGYRIVAWETPGHTPEHTGYLVLDGKSDTPIAFFSGGSLTVQSAGRTDLLGPDYVESLTNAQFESVRRIAQLPGDVQLLPTHGAGSFCTATPGSNVRVSTISAERVSNVALRPGTPSEFADQQLAGLADYPRYYAFMAGINRAGPRVLRQVPDCKPINVNDAVTAIENGAVIVDARMATEFAETHVPGSISIPMGDSLATFVGWLIKFQTPLILVLPDDVDGVADEAMTHLLRIGWDEVVGYVDGGIDAWIESGRVMNQSRTATVDELYAEMEATADVFILDVRQQGEWAEGHIAGSSHFHLGDFHDRSPEIPSEAEVWTICESGERAAIAASLVERSGYRVTAVVGGGVSTWAANGYPVEKPSV
ncbi:MAG: MBL fold metallo-hydrolase [Chloroflexi bacterium]|nr:MBL fold metallo-hydrolase [Chloroflexota bacterium]